MSKVQKALVVTLVLCFILIIPVSALEPTGQNQQGWFFINSVYFKGDDTKVVSATCTNQGSGKTKIAVQFSETFPVGYEFVMQIGFRVEESFWNRTDGAMLGTYTILPDQWLSIRPNSSHNQFWRFSSVQGADEVEYAEYKVSTQNDKIQVTYSTQPQKECHILYFNFFRVRVLEESSTYNFYVYDLDTFEFVDWSVYSSMQIKQNQDKNTQAIIENDKQLQENEKNEASNSANGAADDAAASVPDKSEGFINSVSSFVESMSTTHTEAKLKLPETFIPKIGNLFPQTVLWQEQYINFSEIVAMIPKSIMRIIQAITTIALIVYCYKELYSTIEYVLVMRRGGNE